MTKVLITESSLEDIADAIRGKNGSADTYTPSEMATAITNIPTGDSFNTTPGAQESPTMWVAQNYIIEAPTITIPNSWTSLAGFMQSFNSKVVPKVICGSNITNMGGLYEADSSSSSCIEEIDVSGLDTSNVTNFNTMFKNCSSLTTLDLSDFDFSKVNGRTSTTTARYMFNNASNLTNLTFGSNLGLGYTATAHNSNSILDLSTCTNLSHDSLVDVISKLYDLAGNDKNNQYLKLGSTNIAKLSAAEQQVATDKGWDLQ